MEKKTNIIVAFFASDNYNYSNISRFCQAKQEEDMNINEMISENVNLCSNPSELKITDIRVANINGAPKHCPLIKIYTNQGLVGYGEVRDASSATYALMLKSRRCWNAAKTTL